MIHTSYQGTIFKNFHPQVVIAITPHSAQIKAIFKIEYSFRCWAVVMIIGQEQGSSRKATASSVEPRENWVTRGWRYECSVANLPQRSTALVRAGSRALQERSWWVRLPVGAGVGHNRHKPSGFDLSHCLDLWSVIYLPLSMSSTMPALLTS